MLTKGTTPPQAARTRNPRDSENPKRSNLLGITLARQGKLEEAIEHFREALRIQPEFAAARESLGRALALQGKREEAIQHSQ